MDKIGKAPVWYLAANALPVGRYRALRFLRAIGALDTVARFPFHERTVAVPLNLWPDNDQGRYQYRRIANFASLCDQHLDYFDFVDCGANIGLFSAQFAHFSHKVQRLTAIEPNSELFTLLEQNLQGVRCAEIERINAAVSDFEGRGRLIEPEYGPGGLDAMYLEPDPAGNIEVITLSSVLDRRTRSNAAIKVDVEGSEVAVLCGAAASIRSLAAVAVFVEVHSDVLRRMGMSDVEMLGQIESIRPFTWVNASDGKPIDWRRPVLPQVNLERQCDLIGIGLKS